jgi:O-succinylbenzoic acid--CoA ligase
VINSGGIKLQIEDLERKIEHVFQDLNLTNRFFISAKGDEILGEKVVLIVESNKVIEILSSLDWSEYMAKYEKPIEILYGSRFHETPTGKINRHKSVSNLLS